ncbi:MAG: hypothetical protein Q8P49_03185 [Candidatus Liptonbacteria bacterium]|nr:hypothetical protein [Candidatus Liptonbacteria bacterium]
MRTLYYLPLYHTKADLPRSDIKSLPKSYWRIVEEIWDLIDSGFSSFEIPYKNLRIYGDTQIRSDDIMREAYRRHAKWGGRSARLVLKLLKRGGVLRKTESAPLLILPETTKNTRARDHFMAKRINRTLPKNGTGILLLGIDHGTYFKRFLARDIRVINLFSLWRS